MLLPNHAFLCLFALLFTACQREKAPKQEVFLTTEQHEAVTSIGAEACQTLKKNLGSQLKAALQSGGPEDALHLCQQVAQPLTASANKDIPAATVTRIALRYRNSANQPNEQDRAILEEWETILADGQQAPDSQLISVRENLALYYQPIITEPVCLKCHGDPSTFSPALAQLLTQFYPNDQATGFQKNDLRGAFRVEVSF